MKIHQINLAYIPAEDRLLFRFNTSDKAEFRLLLTRAMSIRMLAEIDSVIHINLGREYPAIVQDSLRAVEDFRREAVVNAADFKTEFSAEVLVYPIGEQPILVIGLILNTSAAVPSLGFQLSNNQILTLSFDHDLAQAVSKLFRDNLSTVDWGIARLATNVADMSSDETRSSVVH